MSVLTSQSLTKNKPQTQLNWAGHPMRSDESYGGRPEHMSQRERMGEARKAIKPLTEERLSILRASMANARKALAEQREKRRLRRAKPKP